MDTTMNAHQYLIGGALSARDCLRLATAPSTEDRSFTSYLQIWTGDVWQQHELDGELISITSHDAADCVVALTSEGDVYQISAVGQVTQETIPDTGLRSDMGALFRIREIAGHLHACGLQGQVFRRDDDGWRHLDGGILDRRISPSALHLNDIDGTALDDLYTIGFTGRIHRFDGRRWTELDSPTNQNLERVTCTHDGTVYIAGMRGTLLRGRGDHFVDLSSDLVTEDFWGMAEFQGRIYLASFDDLYVLTDDAILPVRTGLAPRIPGHRLEARGDFLWSFGAYDIVFFDGDDWYPFL